jgi:long-chain acyl-CoA synthetase
VVKLLVTSMDQLAAANKFNSLEKIKKVYLHPEVFTIESDLLTPSMKLKRGVAAKVFKEQIKLLYGQK